MSTIVYPDQADATAALCGLFMELTARRRDFTVSTVGIEAYRDTDPDRVVTVRLPGYLDRDDVAWLLQWTDHFGRSISFPQGEFPVSVSIQWVSGEGE